jgi:hypothetical protein
MAKKAPEDSWRSLFSPRTIVATCALFVSTCSLVLTIYQMRANRAAQYASVLPYVSCGIKEGNLMPDTTGEFKMMIWNKGIGPAFLHSVRFKVGDKVYDGNDFSHAMQDIGDLPDEVRCTYSSLMPDQLVPSGEEVLWFIPHNKNQAGRIMSKMWNADVPIYDIVICFGDVYGRKWTYTASDARVKPCDECPDIPVNTK